MHGPHLGTDWPAALGRDSAAAEGVAGVNVIAATAGTTEDKKGRGEVGTEHVVKHPAVLRKAVFPPKINLVLKDNMHTGECTKQKCPL